MSAPVLSKAAIADAVASAAIKTPIVPAEAASELVAKVLEHPTVAEATTPISRLQSQNLQGIFVMALAPLVLLGARKMGIELAEGDGAVIATAVVSLVAGVVAWIGRETTTRPLA